MIRVQLHSSVTDEAGWPISALTVEKSGAEWFVAVYLRNPRNGGSRSLLKFPAKDILMNGKSLEALLQAIETKGLLSTFQLK